MAVTPSVLTSGQDSDETQTATTASITPTANRPVLALIYEYDPAGSGIDSVSGAGLTWTSRGTVNSTQDTNVQMYAWTGISASPSSGALTITATTASPDNLHWIIIDLAGASSTPWVQMVSANGSSTAATATLAAFGNAANCAIAWTWMGNPDLMAPETGYTELYDAAAFGGQLEIMYRANNGDLTPQCDLGTTSGWTMMAIEIQDGGAAGGSAPMFRGS